MHDHLREQEWQFAADGLESTREWIARQPAGHSERRFTRCATLELSDTYFDSSDWRIFRAGFALRLRHSREEAGLERNELTLKSLHRGNGAFADRIEFSEQVGAPNLPEALAGNSGIARRIRALVGAGELAPLFLARTRRERQQLLEADSELPLAEVDLDQTSIEAPGGATRDFVRIEVECINAEPAVLEPLVQELADAAHLMPAAESKFRTGLIVAGLEPSVPPALPRREISARQPFACAQAAVLGRFFSRMVDREAAVRVGSEEAVHEMRIAARHLDVLLKSFAPHGPAWAVRSRGAVRALVKALGDVRDCDVQIAYLNDAAKSRTESERRSLGDIRDRVVEERDAAREQLQHTLDSSQTQAWIERWRAELANIDASSPETGPAPSTANVARELIRAQARKFRKRADQLDDESSPDDYHGVRIRAKRLRYILDAFAPLYGRVADDYLRALGKLQTLLGDHHDASVRGERFRKLAAGKEQLSPAASFEMGRLVESDRHALETCRSRFPKAYRRVRRRRWRELDAAMQALDESAR